MGTQWEPEFFALDLLILSQEASATGPVLGWPDEQAPTIH